ncbi:hypothetical protein JCM16303_006298 [Sporobolomyces ruberrimus]
MSNRDSIASTTSRFSSLLTPSSASSSRPSSTTFPISSSSGHPPAPPSTTSIQSNATSGLSPGTASGDIAGGNRRRANGSIYSDHKSLVKTRGNEISLGSWNYLFGEIVQYTQKQVSGISEFEKRLSILGYRIGTRLLELLPLRDSLYPITSTLSRSPPPPSRHLRLLPILTYVHSNLYRYLFGKPADSLEKSTENVDEYMIGDDDMVVTRSIVVPKEMKELSCAALVAGIVEAVLDGSGFPARVTAHSVPTQQHPRRTVLLIKLDKGVLEREQALSAPSTK